MWGPLLVVVPLFLVVADAIHLRSARPYLGIATICHKGNMWVKLDRDLNIRTMVIGTEESSITQSMVHCAGPTPESCVSSGKSQKQEDQGGESCDETSAHCPCQADIQKLPPLYHEYINMARHLESVDIGSLDANPFLSNSSATTTSKAFLIGLGGGMLPQYVLQHSDLSIDVAEISDDVVHAARAFFGVADAEASGRMNVVTSDGYAAISQVAPNSYAAVAVDCCDGDHVPIDCRSPKLIDAIKMAVRPGGVVVQNVPIGGGHSADLDAAMGEYRRAFGREAVSLERESSSSGNAVIVVQVPDSE